MAVGGFQLDYSSQGIWMNKEMPFNKKEMQSWLIVLLLYEWQQIKYKPNETLT